MENKKEQLQTILHAKFLHKSDVLELMQQAYNLAISDAAEAATLNIYDKKWDTNSNNHSCYETERNKVTVDKESILKLKIK